jgi:CRP/FNR family transcriptional regulator, cyclic AMP receptor protein
MDDLRPRNALLRRSHLMQGFTDRTLEAIGDLATEVQFAPGESIVREGDPGDAFFVITSGKAVVEQDGSQLRELGEGDFFGEISLIDGQPRTATITATDEVSTLTLGREQFQRLIDEHPSVRLELLMALTERLRKVAPNPTD